MMRSRQNVGEGLLAAITKFREAFQYALNSGYTGLVQSALVEPNSTGADDVVKFLFVHNPISHSFSREQPNRLEVLFFISPQLVSDTSHIICELYLDFDDGEKSFRKKDNGVMREKILEFEEARLDAMLKGDAGRLEKLMAEGSLYIHSAGGVDSKEVFVEKVRTADLDYKSIENSVEQVNEIEDLFLITGILDISVLRSGVPAEIHIRYLTVWRGGDAPQFISFQATPVAQ